VGVSTGRRRGTVLSHPPLPWAGAAVAAGLAGGRQRRKGPPGSRLHAFPGPALALHAVSHAHRTAAGIRGPHPQEVLFSSRLPHSQSCSSGMADLGLSGSASGSATPPGRMSRSTSEEKGLPDEDMVKLLASNITDYYIALELENKLDKNEEHDDRTSMGRINFVLKNIVVF